MGIGHRSVSSESRSVATVQTIGPPGARAGHAPPGVVDVPKDLAQLACRVTSSAAAYGP
jgi:hypothetical protein